MSFLFHSTIFAGFMVFGQMYQGSNLSQQVSPEVLQQLQKSYKAEKVSQSSEFNRYLSDTVSSKYRSEEDSLDSVSLKDEKPAEKEKVRKQKLSIYEKMISGENIDPDSVLSTLSVYGYDVFKNSRPSTFAPNDNAAVPADYPINSDDEINVMLWGRINEEYKLKVGRDGTINIPRIGPIQVAGLTFESTKKNILDRVGKIEGVSATISMGSLRAVGIYIVGEVVSPGYYTVSALSNVTNALFAAGGPSKSGSLRNVQLKRNGQKIASFDFYDFLMSSYDKTGFRLQSGDVIVVPLIQSMAAVVGNVRRNALYELNGKTSLEKIITLAGGTTASAWTNKIQIERFNKNEHRIVLDLDSCNGKLPDVEIHDGDIVKIFPILDKDNNAVYLSGNVLRPGKYEFKDGMRIRDLIMNYNSILPETYFDYAVIYRFEPPSYMNNIIPFNLKKVLEDNNASENIALKARDQIIVYNKDFFEPDRYVFVDGSVTKAGRYKLLDNMKIRDLILQAGGLRDEASPIRGELYRRQSANVERISTEKLDFCVECAMADSSGDNLILRKSDHIFIRSKMGWEEERKVLLRGQIVYPGKYILYEGETLGDLIKRAGGFKDDAYLAAAVFTRKSVKEFENKRMEEYSHQLETDIMKLSAEIASKENPEEAQVLLAQQMALKDKLKISTATGRVVIDIRNQKNYDDFSLEDGDEVYIPRNQNTVSVLGEVYNPSTFKYDNQNITVFHYIESAGGLKEESADNKHLYIIKANGSIITNKTTHILTTALEPGDAVVVPQKLKYSNGHKAFVETVEAIFKIATVLATIATLAYTVSKL
jgi:protein involved in polysaccharide export with SLBB domain